MDNKIYINDYWRDANIEKPNVDEILAVDTEGEVVSCRLYKGIAEKPDESGSYDRYVDSGIYIIDVAYWMPMPKIPNKNK